ncbi:MAG: PIN domain nuclease [Ignavibacteria bacterium]|nr:PIN domain nuclease [Ignavibacteria bacterium]
MILIDSSTIIDFFNGIENRQTSYLNDALGRENFIIGDIILAEVLQGFRTKNDFIKAKELLSDFPIYNLCGKEIAVKSTKNFRTLREKGITCRKTIDSIIAAFCIENEITLLHNDKDFILFETEFNLRVIHLD